MIRFKDFLNEAKEVMVTYELVGGSDAGYGGDVIASIVYDMEDEHNFEAADVYEDEDFNTVVVATDKQHKIIQKAFSEFVKELTDEGYKANIRIVNSVEVPSKDAQLSKILTYILQGAQLNSDADKFKKFVNDYKRGKLEYKITATTITVQDSDYYGQANIKKDKELVAELKKIGISDLKELAKELENTFNAVKNSKINK